ncbi:MAG TPA: GatB/YqeY domain-containing protein [Nitrospiria bacterium]|nr:GatB/YqeY domain-containing protein [Nitrospiria bacterium]
MSLQQRLLEEMKTAMRDGDALKVSVIRLLRASIKNKEISKGRQNPLTEQDILETIISATKQRKDSIEQFTKGKRMDLVAKERNELEILQTYLPQSLSVEELKAKAQALIKEIGANGQKDMGKIMKILMPQVAGKIDGSVVGQVVKDLLTPSS